MRKKFKKQQKEILDSLRLKKEEEERKVRPSPLAPLPFPLTPVLQIREAVEREELKKEKLRRRCVLLSSPNPPPPSRPSLTLPSPGMRNFSAEKKRIKSARVMNAPLLRGVAMQLAVV
jgi:hypothetical protein